MKEISTEINIQGSIEDVWNVLTDFPSYPKWNPFIRHITGHPIVGSRLELEIMTPKKKIRKYSPIVTSVIPNSELRWHGKSFIPGILDGEHIFKINENSARSIRFEHKEIFSGVGALIGGKFLVRDILESENKMNQALKREVEYKTKTRSHST